MIRFYRFPMSTNCDRLALALAHKGIEVESVNIDPEDRSQVRKVSGQTLVPVLEIDGDVLVDSMTIVRALEDRYPQKPLYPADPARRTEMEIFIDWFNRVWKVPPNAMEAEMGKDDPDMHRIHAWSVEMDSHLPRFDRMLEGREFLFGDNFSAADVCAWPFLRYAVFQDDNDPWLFHRILVDHQQLKGRYSNLEAWIRRIREYPQA